MTQRPQRPTWSDSVEDFMDRMFDSWVSARPHWRAQPNRYPFWFEADAWTPPIDVLEDAEKTVIRVDVPGVEPDAIEVTMHSNTVTIRGSRSQEPVSAGTRFRRSERRFGEFSRSVQVPAGTDPSSIKAAFKNGVLEVTVPKNSSPGPTNIPIDAE